MRTVLRKGFQSFEIFEWHDCSTEDVIIRFSDRYSAFVFLGPFLGDSVSMANIRGLLYAISPDACISRLSDHQVLELFAQQLFSGRLQIAKPPQFSGAGASGAASRHTDSESEPEPARPAKQERAKAWIEIELLDWNNQPVVNERYIITLPDGDHREGKTDAKGQARVTDIDPGTCKVTFPELDGNIWDRVSRAAAMARS